MNILIDKLASLPKFSEYISNIKNKISPQVISGLSSVGKIQIVEGTRAYAKKNILLVTYNEIQAKRIAKDLKYFSSNVLFFPKREITAYDYEAESKDLPYERIETLNRLYEQEENDGKPVIIVTTIEAIMQKILSKDELYKNVLEFEVGKTYDLEALKETLIYLGFERSELIEGKGQFSVRGGIVDIGITKTQGYRIEFWGDEVDSVRSFSIISQRSNKMLDKAVVYPSSELVAPEIKRESTLLDYIDENFLICIDDIEKIEARQKNILEDNKKLIQNLIEKNRPVPESIENFSRVDIEKKVKNQYIYLYETDMFSNEKKTKYSNNIITFKYRDVHFFKSELNILIKEIKEAVESKKNVVVLAGNEQGAKKIENLLSQEEIKFKFFEKLEEKEDKIFQTSIEEAFEKRAVIISSGSLSSGFENHDMNLLVVTGEEFMTSNTTKRKYTDSFKNGEKVVFADLKVGDYVVHKNQGIGIYIGVNTITTADNVTKDYIKLKYKNEDTLYVPTENLDNIRKYIGGGEQEPKLNRLGSKEWEHTKAKVKNNLKEVARDLIELYAKRRKAKGFMFSKDTPWQKQFEESFPYVETEDQLRCIEEVKKDMEQEKPMDRLLCGDVGYGKTEVAIRAAFKAVMDQKQVAYLVPTTILANQQYEEFKARMQEFAINVELLNRFRTKKQQEQVIKKLKLGEVDVVIGTHRILSNDIEFKDLGLLIIDEEQRFGVKAKEKIKRLKENVDVLTMTATPIPRTLHMSIIGVRDMSVIYEPPQDRKPVQTYVLEHDDEVVKEAITKEIERSGQVFYLFNNVEKIARKANDISNLVPEAKVAFAHGKMTGQEIENIMMEFIDHKIDVLVCTTILESGIDIPNANTIIVENADRLGLAQLYQIRGRVGRSNKQAYCYITYRRDKVLSEIADKRLKAIKEFTEFGSGFKIAMRDLEIRGAGSLLGEIQSGHLEQVGYDTYCKLLDEVVKEMQGEEPVEEKEVTIDIKLSSYIPENYIEDGAQKIEIYQDIALCKNEEDIADITDEIIDRFGTMPKEVENLLEIARIKILAKAAGVIKVSQKENSVVILLDKNNISISPEKLVGKYKNSIRFSPGVEPYITLNTKEKDEEKYIKIVKELLIFLASNKEEGKQNAGNYK